MAPNNYTTVYSCNPKAKPHLKKVCSCTQKIILKKLPYFYPSIQIHGMLCGVSEFQFFILRFQLGI